MKKVASLRYDVIFKKAFCDVSVFKGFVRDILGIQLEIDTVETEKEFAQPVGRVKPEFDLFAEDKKNRIIVDIQHEKHSDHYDRFLHYHCAAILEQIPNSKDYKPPLAVYTIVVLTSGDSHKCDVSVIDFDPKKINGQSLGIIKHKMIYICPKYMDDNTPPPYREWLRVINESLTEQIDESSYCVSEVQKIIAYIKDDEISPEERATMIEEYHNEESQIRALKRAELLTKISIAKNMQANNLDIKSIASMTGLSEEHIKKIDDIDIDAFVDQQMNYSVFRSG